MGLTCVCEVLKVFYQASQSVCRGGEEGVNESTQVYNVSKISHTTHLQQC